MKSHLSQSIKTTLILEKDLIAEIDKLNPYPTRKEFMSRACRAYLVELRKALIDERLAAACSESAEEDLTIYEEWDPVSTEMWE